MIINDTLNQPLALAIYAILGVIFGIIYAANYFACTFILKSKIYRHLSQVIYVIAYAIIFFAVTYKYFDFALKLYQLAICIIITIGTSAALYLPVKKKKRTISDKCNIIISKVQQSKAVKRFKK